MPMLSSIEWVARHRQIYKTICAGESVSERRIVALLREGWDYSSEVAGAFDEWGMFRAPHLGILAGLSREAYPGSPLLEMDMSVSEIESGLYRQCRIMPGEPKERSIPSSADYAVKNCPHYEPDREWIFQALIGHTPRDLARLLHVYNPKHSRVGKFLLAKDFRAAFALAPELLTREGWPSEVTRFWRNRDMRRILAPADALADWAYGQNDMVLGSRVNAAALDNVSLSSASTPASQRKFCIARAMTSRRRVGISCLQDPLLKMPRISLSVSPKANFSICHAQIAAIRALGRAICLREGYWRKVRFDRVNIA